MDFTLSSSSETGKYSQQQQQQQRLLTVLSSGQSTNHFSLSGEAKETRESAATGFPTAVGTWVHSVGEREEVQVEVWQRALEDLCLTTIGKGGGPFSQGPDREARQWKGERGGRRVTQVPQRAPTPAEEQGWADEDLVGAGGGLGAGVILLVGGLVMVVRRLMPHLPEWMQAMVSAQTL